MTNIRQNPFLTLNLGISLSGLFLVLILASNAPTIQKGIPWRKPLVGLVFSIICMFGILAALSPRQCSRSLHFRRENLNSTDHQIHLSSHHPDCEEFSAHVIHISGHDLCAACTGLLFGAVIALIGSSFYFFGGWHIKEAGLGAVLAGVVGVVLGFFQLRFRGFVRLVCNMFFVLGAFLILVGMDELIESLFVDCFLLALTVFWILTRIQLSQWDHWRICSSCKSPCEERIGNDEQKD